jgi:hypothetical protein
MEFAVGGHPGPWGPLLWAVTVLWSLLWAVMGSGHVKI